MENRSGVVDRMHRSPYADHAAVNTMQQRASAATVPILPDAVGRDPQLPAFAVRCAWRPRTVYMHVRTDERKRQTSSIPGGILAPKRPARFAQEDLVTVLTTRRKWRPLKAMTLSRHSLRIDPIRAFGERIQLRARFTHPLNPSAESCTVRRISLSQRIPTCGVPVISSTFGQAANNFPPPASRASASLLRQVLE